MPDSLLDRHQNLYTDRLRDENSLSRLLREITILLGRNPDFQVIVQKAITDQATSVASVDLSSASIAHLRGREAWPLMPSVPGRRIRRKENPAAFIKRVYADVLASGTLTRAQLQEVDPRLCNAYSVWITPARHPEDDLGLPTGERRTFDDPAETLAHRRELIRAAGKRHRLKKKAIDSLQF